MRAGLRRKRQERCPQVEGKTSSPPYGQAHPAALWIRYSGLASMRKIDMSCANDHRAALEASDQASIPGEVQIMADGTQSLPGRCPGGRRFLHFNPSAESY